MMKTKIKISLLATSLLVFGRITNVHAQNWLTAGNGLTGGTSSTPAEWLGSNNAYDFIIRTNNLPRMRVLSGGHVLMGSGTAATYPLTLNDYTNAGTLSSGGNFSVSFHSITGGVAIGGQDTGNNNAVFGTTGSSSAILFATFNGSSFDERARITSAGNVAIGTTSPSEKLSIIETVATTIAQISSAQSGGASKSYWGNYNDQLWMSAGGTYKNAWVGDNANRTIPYMVMTAGNADSYIAFATTASNNSQATERFRIIKDGKVGIGTTSPGYILTVNGEPGANGYTQFTNYSDAQLKTNISDIDSSLSKILQLHPVQFNYNQSYLSIYKDTILPSDMAELQVVHKGFIAQEVKQIFPEMVGIDSVKGQAYCDLNLSNLQVYIVKAIQEQQAIIDSLKQNQKITDSLLSNQKAKDSLLMLTINNMLIHQQTTDSLLATIANCCLQNSTPKMMLNNGGQTQGENLQVELANNNQIILFQNQPNPFNESTVIRYFVPENITGSAFVIFYDMYGQEIKRTEITTKGFGNINVNAENLLSGVYSYSLMVNEKVIDTKKMIKNK